MIIPTPTSGGSMATVDSKRRIVLTQEVRERVDITPGTEVEIHEEDRKAVVEPEIIPNKSSSEWNSSLMTRLQNMRTQPRSMKLQTQSR